jgi:hypothetical protein
MIKEMRSETGYSREAIEDLYLHQTYYGRFLANYSHPPLSFSEFFPEHYCSDRP